METALIIGHNIKTIRTARGMDTGNLGKTCGCLTGSHKQY